MSYSRRKTRVVKAGNVLIGGDNPVVIQSMCNTDTRDVSATVSQIKALEKAGCEMVRVAVPDMIAAQAIGKIKEQISIPLVADIHFDYKLAVEAMAQGIDKIRINPGNIGSKEKVRIVADMAKEKGITVLMSLHEIDLAQKCADRIVCVRGEEIMAYGTPEEVFYEETIEKLYDLDNGSYNPLSGSLELKKTEGEPEVFVISSGGNGTPIYRKLQREGRPFAAGILYTNDVDYQAARVLASKIITEEPFEEISDNTYKNAENMIDQCQSVVNAGVHIGSCNHRMRNLLQYAQEKGKLKRDYL